MSKPNLLMIMTDQQRFGSLGCYGNRGVPTPNLDRLAAEGARFTHCYCNATICTPSRAGIMTGRPVPGHGVYKLHVSGRVTEAQSRHPQDGFDIYEWSLDPTIHVDSALNSYIRWLKDNHPDVLEEIHKYGRRTRHFAYRGHFSRWAAERVIDFLRTRGKQGPFFCKMSLFDPHDPYDDYPPEAADLVHCDLLPPIVSSAGGGDPVPRGIQREKDKSYFKGGKGPSQEQLHAIRLGYYASIAFLDGEIGRVLQTLDDLELAQNTLVLLVSDHGDMIGDHELITKGAYFYDACSRVPFLMRFPGTIPQGIVVESLVQPHDIAATVLGVGGVAPKEISTAMPHSRDLLAVIRNPEVARDFAVTYYRNSGYGPGGRYFDPPIDCRSKQTEE